ncbi:hypothetical protein CPB86DRAFT_871599, partial [Serendipita vermifera]
MLIPASDYISFSLLSRIPGPISTRVHFYSSRRMSFTNGKKVSFGKAGASGSGQVPRVAPRLRDQHIGEVFARLAQRKEAQRDEEQRIRTSGSGRPLKRRKLEVITIDSSPERGRSLANPIHIESSPQAVPQPVVENVLVESSPDVIPSAPVNTGRPSKGKGRVAGLPIPPTVTHDGAGPSSMAKGKGRVIEPSPVRHRDIGSSRPSRPRVIYSSPSVSPVTPARRPSPSPPSTPTPTIGHRTRLRRKYASPDSSSAERSRSRDSSTSPRVPNPSPRGTSSRTTGSGLSKGKKKASKGSKSGAASTKARAKPATHNSAENPSFPNVQKSFAFKEVPAVLKSNVASFLSETFDNYIARGQFTRSLFAYSDLPPQEKIKRLCAGIADTEQIEGPQFDDEDLSRLTEEVAHMLCDLGADPDRFDPEDYPKILRPVLLDADVQDPEGD